MNRRTFVQGVAGMAGAFAIGGCAGGAMRSVSSSASRESAVLQAWIAAYGVPRALYTDWKTVYKREPTLHETVRGEEALTQFGRMCQKLDIAIIGAASPQAKGRVERSHGTQQDRGWAQHQRWVDAAAQRRAPVAPHP